MKPSTGSTAFPHVPTVSVIIPAFNHEKYVSQCIDSVLAQTYTDLEIIVVDDGSVDGTLDILRRYGDRVNLIAQPNQGTQAARNTAIRASSGRYIALLDSDDGWLPKKLERQMAVFAAQPTTRLVYGQVYLVDSEGTRQGSAVLGRPILDQATAYEQMLIENPIPALTAVVRRSCFDELGLFDESLIGAADWDMWLRIAARWPVFGIAEPLGFHRIHQTNTTHELCKSRLLLSEHVRVLDRAFANPARAVSAQTRSKALARVHLIEAELAASEGDAAGAGRGVAQAIPLDPGLADNLKDVVANLVYRARQRGGQPKSARQEVEFYRQFFAALGPSSPTIRRLRKATVGEAAMRAVFALHAQGRAHQTRALIPIGILAQPRWLLSRGVWSIAVEAFLGAKLAGQLRSLARRFRSR